MNAITSFFQSLLCCEAVNVGIMSEDFNGAFAYDMYSFHDYFELGEVLGEGGYAVVRFATAIKTKQKVAVKIAKRSDIDAGRESALRLEFETLRSLQHPNIVQAVGLFEEAKNFYVVLEYMEGGELFDRIVKKTQYSEKEARDAVRCVLAALQYMHARKIVHRDLKPENLLLESLDNDSNLKIADFGLAKVLDGPALISKAGTPEYWAPEVLEARPISTSVDMWSLGVIAFVLLGGYAPFHHRDPSVMYANIGKAAFKFHPQRWGNVSDNAKDFISSLLIVDPSQRLSAEEALMHPWVRTSDVILRQRSLLENLQEFKKYNALRKFQAGVRAVRGAHRLLKLASKDVLLSSGSSSTLEPSSITFHQLDSLSEEKCPTIVLTDNNPQSQELYKCD